VACTAQAADDGGPPAQYRLEPRHSSVTFTLASVVYPHLVMRFHRWNARLDQRPDIGETGRVIVTIDAASIDGSSPLAASIAKGGGLLDVERYPDIRFVSTQFERTSDDGGLLVGNLTLHGVTRRVVLAVTLGQVGGPPEAGAAPLAFYAEGHFSRAAFGLSSWRPLIGDDVHMKIRAEFVPATGNPAPDLPDGPPP